jgi:hypothetical protein
MQADDFIRLPPRQAAVAGLAADRRRRWRIRSVLVGQKDTSPPSAAAASAALAVLGGGGDQPPAKAASIEQPRPAISGAQARGRQQPKASTPVTASPPGCHPARSTADSRRSGLGRNNAQTTSETTPGQDRKIGDQGGKTGRPTCSNTAKPVSAPERQHPGPSIPKSDHSNRTPIMPKGQPSKPTPARRLHQRKRRRYALGRKSCWFASFHAGIYDGPISPVKLTKSEAWLASSANIGRMARFIR